LEASARPRIRAGALVVPALVALVVLSVDQVSKFLVVSNLRPYEEVEVFGALLKFDYVRNSGAAFSIGSGYTWVFSIVGLAVLVFIVWFARRIRSMGWAVLFGLLLGGLLGNLTDRLTRAPGFGMGEVVDFLKIPVLPAIFNLADVAIVTSMALFLVLTLTGRGLDGRRARLGMPAHAAETPHDS